jgi:hypothetical protein
VLKNFPDETELRATLAPYAEHIEWEAFEYYWLVWGERS